MLEAWQRGARRGLVFTGTVRALRVWLAAAARDELRLWIALASRN